LSAAPRSGEEANPAAAGGRGDERQRRTNSPKWLFRVRKGVKFYATDEARANPNLSSKPRAILLGRMIGLFLSPLAFIFHLLPLL